LDLPRLPEFGPSFAASAKGHQMGQGQGLRNLLPIVLVAAPAALGYALEDRPAQTGRGGELPEVSPEDDLFLDELEFLNSCIATEAHRRFCLELG